MVSIHPGPPVTLNTDIPETTLGAENARNLGLLLNELVTNAMKHGFDGEKHPHINVRLEPEEDRYVLTVANNGALFPENISLTGPHSSGSGINLIANIVDALDGSITLHRDPETEIQMEFSASVFSI